jgi:hypothetical protein
MNPAEKYMSQASLEDNDIKFVPPSFMNRNLNDDISYEPNNNRGLDLFTSETGLPELCYYSNEADDTLNRSYNINTANNTVPTTFDILRNLDLDLDETEDLERAYSDNDVNKIYSRIEQRHPGIFATLYSYRIPRPIVRVIIKRLIRLTLSYCKKNNNY